MGTALAQMTPVIIIFVGWIVYMLISNSNKNKYTSTNEEFSQSDVVVNFLNKTIDIKGSHYNVNQINKLYSESDRGLSGKTSKAYISVDDFENPLHMISFYDSKNAEQFLLRLRLALTKAGWKK